MKTSSAVSLLLIGVSSASTRRNRNALYPRQASESITVTSSSNNATMTLPAADIANIESIAVFEQVDDRIIQDCGDGDVPYTAEEWKYYDMDKTLKDFHEAGIAANPNFDFSHAWNLKIGTAAELT